MGVVVVVGVAGVEVTAVVVDAGAAAGVGAAAAAADVVPAADLGFQNQIMCFINIYIQLTNDF